MGDIELPGNARDDIEAVNADRKQEGNIEGVLIVGIAGQHRDQENKEDDQTHQPFFDRIFHEDWLFPKRPWGRIKRTPIRMMKEKTFL